MKVALITQNAPIYLPFFLDRFLSQINSKHDIVFAAILPSVKKSFFKEAIERYNYYGVSAFFQMVCYILYKKLFALIPGSNFSASVEKVFKKNSIDYSTVCTVNDQEFLEQLKGQKIDVIISVAAPEIFKKELLAIPKIGCINYHTGMLPRYRGRQPLFWALLNNESEIGITIHFMNEVLDDGPIIYQEKVRLAKNESLHSLYKKTIRIGPKVLVKAIELLDTQNFCMIPNDSSKSEYFGFPTQKDSKRFRRTKRFFLKTSMVLILLINFPWAVVTENK